MRSMKANKTPTPPIPGIAEAKLAYIRWIDIHSSDPWQDKWPVDYDPFTVESVGWLVEVADGIIVIPNRHCPSKGHEETQYYGQSHIPTGCILNIHYIPTSRIKNYGK